MELQRMSIELLESVYQLKRYGFTNGNATKDDCEKLPDIIDGETFGDYYDRMKPNLNLFEENTKEIAV